MKKVFWILTLLSTTLAYTSCKEVAPAIDYSIPNTELVDTTYINTTLPTAPEKMILLEEFTGLMCVNCPAGHTVASDLALVHPGKIVNVAIHSYFQDPPASWENFEIPEGLDIDNYLGPVVGWPAAAINRKVFSGKIIQEGTAGWNSAVTSELGNTASVSLDIVNTFDTESRTLKTKITTHLLSDLSSKTLDLSVMLNENDIINFQKTPTGTDSFYVHEHVLRDMFTAFNGWTLSASNTTGRVYEKEFEMVLPQGWDASKCEVVAIVHENSASKEVLQAKSVSLF